MSSCFLLNPTCVTLIARPGNSYEITEPNQMTSDPESRCIEYSFFNDHLHLKWFLLKIFCWLFKDPNTSQPIRKSWYCLLSLFMVHGSLTVAGSLLLYLTSHICYLNCLFFWGYHWAGEFWQYISIIKLFMSFGLSNHTVLCYISHTNVGNALVCVFQAWPVRYSCLKTSWSELFSSIMVFFLHFFRLCYACLSMILMRKDRYDNFNLA